MATSVLPDLPTTEDHLDFEASAATLAGILGDENTATPITVGVFGTWGTGKTSLMRMIEAALRRQVGRQTEPRREAPTLYRDRRDDAPGPRAESRVQVQMSESSIQNPA